ncbi:MULTISPECIES: hypothetical protein [Pontibacillus]|uniref:Uncharacterized protein n=1 Tax=Pontibacillus chungwhensis TaxID=265426 RepID=A0ABY8UZ27_9BACI|nr:MULTISPECIES: hypothetical protein [Pontibacillus]MCD5324774.1 hypothetical protein [Pontibacillus sp. HN14]WIF98734.1 hypothetical protein QNI29_03520 [Pontibacillus chungwhensis]
MIPLELQDDLKKELEKLFVGIPFPLADGEEGPLNIYEQYLPTKSGRRDSNQYPCLLVKLLEGEEQEEEAPYTIQVTLMAGVYDGSEERIGHESVKLILRKVYDFLKKKPVIGGKFECTYPIKWALTDEDFHPYYYGGIEASFTVPKTIREDVNHLL